MKDRMHGLCRCFLWSCAVVLATVCCDDPTGPSFDLSGNWGYTFVARNDAPCVDPELQQGCSGAGTLTLVQSGHDLQGDNTRRGACQTCGLVVDYGGTTPLADGKLIGGRLSFTSDACRFRAMLSDPQASVITGEVSCTLPSDLEATGTWSMARLP